ERITPPMLAPLYASPSAAGRARTNQGETIALIAAALIPPQPSPLGRAAAKRCHGSAATDHPKAPAARQSAAVLVTTPAPRCRWIAGRLAPVTAPTRKCTVIAAEMRETGQPFASWMTPRKT